MLCSILLKCKCTQSQKIRIFIYSDKARLCHDIVGQNFKFNKYIALNDLHKIEMTMHQLPEIVISEEKKGEVRRVANFVLLYMQNTFCRP